MNLIDAIKSGRPFRQPQMVGWYTSNGDQFGYIGYTNSKGRIPDRVYQTTTTLHLTPEWALGENWEILLEDGGLASLAPQSESEVTIKSPTPISTTLLYVYTQNSSVPVTGHLYVDENMTTWSLPDDWGYVPSDDEQIPQCDHEWVDTGMKKSWCKKCPAKAEMVDGKYQEILEKK